MNTARLRALVEHAVNSGSTLSQFDEAGIRLTVRSIDTPVLAPAEPDTILSLAGPGMIHSSLFGMLHLQPGGDAPPFVSLGQTVQAGQKIGLIEAMKVFSPVVAHRTGRIVAVLAEHGAEVECGQPLFHVE